MKKLHITLITLFVLFAAQAQSVTEENLLGEWNLRKISQMGTVADLKTGDVVVSDELVAKTGQTKEALAAQFKERAKTMRGTLLFMPDKKMKYEVTGASAAEGTYMIAEENGKQYLADEYSGTKMEIYYKDGLLYWEVLGNGGIVIMAWQKQAEVKN